jgi:hypothetical protein
LGSGGPPIPQSGRQQRPIGAAVAINPILKMAAELARTDPAARQLTAGLIAAITEFADDTETVTGGDALVPLTEPSLEP